MGDWKLPRPVAPQTDQEERWYATGFATGFLIGAATLLALAGIFPGVS